VVGLPCAANLSDRQAADAVRRRIAWKDLWGLDVEDPGLAFSILSECRDRLLMGGLDRRFLDARLERFRERGLLKARGKQRTDSTHIQAAARHLSRLACVGETLRQALQCLAEIAPQWLQAHGPPDWYAR